jgi:1-deoxy-D-xylulose-5-phosphate reductoisomerase
LLSIRHEALEKGGNAACVLNASNEVAVEAFLNDRIGFLEMSDVIEETLIAVDFVKQPSLEDFIETYEKSRIITNELINKHKKI